MGLWDAEKKVKEIILNHFSKIIDGSYHFENVFELYLEKNCDVDEEMLENIEKMHKIESEADKIRHELKEFLYEGNILPNLRGDLIRLIEKNDKIMNKLESLLDFYTLQKIYIHTTLKDDFRELIKLNTKTLEVTYEATKIFFEDLKEAMEKIKEIGRCEHNVDKKERELISKVFKKNISLSERILLREFVNLLADVSDLAENTGDILETIIIRLSF